MLTVVALISLLLRPVDLDGGEGDFAGAYAALITKQMAIRSMQISVGYSLGLVCVLSGVLFSWNGVRGAIELEAQVEKTTVKIKTAQVGVVVLLCGVGLIALAMLSPRAKITPPGVWQGETVLPPHRESSTFPAIEI